MKILIAGSDLNAKLLARYLKLEDNSHDIYITSDEQTPDESYTPVNIKENDIASICDFVKYNQIEFTIATSAIAIINGIADEFKRESFPIFAPFSEAEKITYFNSIAKKIMYKLKINTPRFGIFDRENLAIEYVRKAKFPIVVENDFTLQTRESHLFTTFSKARIGIQKMFEENNDKIVIENYINKEPIYVYFVTDGYSALPLISTSRNDLETIAPAPKLSEDMLVSILQRAIYPLLDDITKYAGSYTGILGLKIKIHNNSFYVLEFYNGFQQYDFQAFLSLLSDNLLDILYDAAMGSLADNHNFINLAERFSYTAAVAKNNFEPDYDEDFTISEDETNYVITDTACTLNRAKERIQDYLESKGITI